MPFQMQTASAGEHVAYWQNTSTSRELVISSIGINSAENSRLKLWFVTGTAAAGTLVSPTNLNRQSSNEAEGISQEGASAATGITGLTESELIDFLYCGGAGHEEFRLHDRLRLGEGDAIAIEYDEGTDGDVGGVIFAFYEKSQEG